jgi:hypothetical protein
MGCPGKYGMVGNPIQFCCLALTNWLPSALHFGLEFTGLFYAINAKTSDSFELAVMTMSYWNVLITAVKKQKFPSAYASVSWTDYCIHKAELVMIISG